MWTEAVDLHSHSTHSDGVFSVAELAHRMRKQGVKVWSLTDHDTTVGWEEAQAVSGEMVFLPGVEVTCEPPLECAQSSWHVLCWFPEGCVEFREWMESKRDERRPRMQAMVNALNELGQEITMEDVEAQAGQASLGRPHLARAMVERGIVTSVAEAFEKWINDEGPAFRERPLPSVGEVVQRAHAEGGITSLAHPYWTEVEDDVLMDIMSEIGFDCVEAFHQSQPDSYRYRIWQAAAARGIYSSVGADCHGTGHHPDPGRMPVPISALHPKIAALMS